MAQRWAVGAVLAAAFFRVIPLLENRFHPDEALYAYFGRLIVSGRDPLLAQVVVDKPPLPFYLLAGSFGLFGGGEFAARLPSFFASLVSVALVYALARRLYGRPAAALSAWLLALSPFAILFAITLFIDPLLTALVLGGLWQAAARRPRGSALAFALAFLAKQTALLFLPLAAALYLASAPPEAHPREALRSLSRYGRAVALGLALAALVTFGWDTLRLQFGAPISFWAQGFSDNAPNRLIRSGEVLPRARAWLDLLGYITASPILNGALALGLPGLLLTGLRRPARAALTDLVFAGYLVGYLAAYWLLAFNVWDRYLLPVAPLLLVLLARVSLLMAERLRATAARAVLVFAACLLLLPSALTASRSAYPIGGDHGAYAGLDDTARFLNALPYGAVLYDFWLSWQWNFYLFDGKVYVAWMPSPEALAVDLRAFGRTSPRYLVVPAWESAAEARAAAGGVGFTLEPVHTSYRPDGSPAFVVYQFQSTNDASAAPGPP